MTTNPITRDTIAAAFATDLKAEIASAVRLKWPMPTVDRDFVRLVVQDERYGNFDSILPLLTFNNIWGFDHYDEATTALAAIEEAIPADLDGAELDAFLDLIIDKVKAS